MSSVTLVPETRDLDSDDARKTLRRTGVRKVTVDAFVRFRYSDGFSFARSLGFQVVLTLVPGAIFVVSLAARIGEGRLQSLLRDLITSLAPGPAGDMFLQAFRQGEEAGSTGNLVAILGGGAVMLLSAVVAMAQLQRGATRIYGIETDRPTIRRYAVATGLTLTAGLLLTAAFVLVALGSGLASSFRDGAGEVWTWIRWPAALLLLIAAFAALYKAVPNRHQPHMSWLAGGSGIGVGLWFAISSLLAIYLNASTAFGQTYGPLAGFVGVMAWAQLSSMAILYGLAFAAQLEAARAGITEPRTDDAAREDDIGIIFRTP